MSTEQLTVSREMAMDRRLLFRKATEKIAVLSVAGCAFIAVLVLGLILGYVVHKGIAYINWGFLTSLPAPAGEEGGGIANAIVGSFIIVGIGAVIALPIGMGAAIFINEFPSPILGKLVRFLAELLTAVPSIVVGIFVYELVVAPAGHFSGYSGSVAYAFIMIPIVVVAAQEALHLVPQSLREASLALGISKWVTTMRIVLPVASRALITGALLAVARALGETAPMMFTSFGNQFWNADPNKPMASIPLLIYRYAVGPYDDWHRQAWAAAFLLVVIVLGVSILTRFVLRRKFDD